VRAGGIQGRCWMSTYENGSAIRCSWTGQQAHRHFSMCLAVAAASLAKSSSPPTPTSPHARPIGCQRHSSPNHSLSSPTSLSATAAAAAAIQTAIPHPNQSQTTNQNSSILCWPSLLRAFLSRATGSLDSGASLSSSAWLLAAALATAPDPPASCGIPSCDAGALLCHSGLPTPAAAHWLCRPPRGEVNHMFPQNRAYEPTTTSHQISQQQAASVITLGTTCL